MTNRLTRAAKTFPRMVGGLAAASALVFVPTGCGKDTPPPAPAPADVATAAPTPPPAPVSRLSEAQNFDRTAITTANLGAALELATALQKEGTPETRTAAIRLRLMAVVAMDAKKTAPEGFDAEAQLRQALTLAEDGGAVDAPLARAAGVLLRIMNPATAPAYDTAAIRDILAAGATDTVPADVIRVAARKGLAAIGEGLSNPTAFADVSARFGNFVCASCNELGVTPADKANDVVGTCLPDDKSAGCAVTTEVAKLDPVFAEPANRFAVALLEELSVVASQPLANPGLGQVVPVAPAVRNVALPMPVPPAFVPSIAGADKAPTATADAPNLVATIGADGLGLGQLPFVQTGGAVPMHGYKMLASQGVIAFDGLTTEDEVQPVTARLRTLLPEGPAAEEANVAIAVAPTAAGDAVGKALAALQTAGLQGTRLIAARSGAETPVAAQVPFVVRQLPLTTALAINSGAERELMVVVNADSIDIWGPEGDIEKTESSPAIAPVRDDRAGDVPGDYQPGWRGKTLVRLRLPLPAQPEAAPDAPPAPVVIDAETMQKVVGAVAWWRGATGSGPVIQVAAGNGATAQPVIDVARAIQEARDVKAPVTAEAGIIWRGASCSADGCPGQVAVVFSARDIPSDRGISDGPAAKKEPTKPAQPKPEAASPEFCNKNDIQVQMRKNTGRMRFCYEKELQLDNSLKGRVNARFTIGLDGKVSSVATSGSLTNKNVTGCVERELRKISFAKPEGGACLVSWPFVFGGE